MSKRMRKVVLVKRIFAFLLAASMIFGELGTMNVSAQEPVGAQAAGESDEQDTAQADSASGEDKQDGEQDPDPAEGTEEMPGEKPEEPDAGEEPSKGEELPKEEEPPEEDETLPPAENDLTDITEDAESLPQAAGTLAAPTNLSLFVDINSSSEGGGEVRLCWYYNVSWDDESYSFDIYRSETKDGEYKRMEVSTYAEDFENHIFSAYIPIGPMDPETGNARKFYFKVKAIHQEEDGTLTESAFSEIIENERILQGSGYETPYKGMCFLYDGKPVHELELHVGETKKLGLGLIKKDGTVVPMKSLKSQMSNIYKHIDWKAGLVKDLKIDWFIDSELEDSGEYTDIEFSMENDVLHGYEQYVTANQLLGSEKEKHYFIEVAANADPVFGFFVIHIPVTILEAEEGVTYEKGFTPAHICTTKEEAYAYAREIQRNRTTGTILVEEGVFNQGNIYRALNPEQIYDTYAERGNMKPDEGDYIFYHIGDLSKKAGEIVMIDGYKYEQLSAGGIYYDAYTFSGPYLTTRAQEDKVDAKIQELLSPGGALYSVSQTGTDTQKAEGIASYVKGHVTYKGTTDPKYHTCYSALIDGIGTCEAYSLLYMRLAREMGLASKMVGTAMDSSGNCHDFNIVRVDGKWYHIDALGDCKLHTGRPGATLAPTYLDQRFINNYLSKISGSGYQYVSNGTVTIEDDLGEKEEFSSLFAAKDRVKELASLEENQDRTYQVLISKSMKPDDLDALDFGEAADRVTVNLCGHTLTVIDMSALYVRAAHVTNGAITVGSESSLTLLPFECEVRENSIDLKQSVYDHLSISWKQTTSGVSYQGNRWGVFIGDWTAIDPSPENPGSVCLEDSVTISSNLYNLFVQGDVEIQGNVEAKSISLDGNARICGNVTANELLISGNEVVLDGKVKATKGLCCRGNITIKDDWTVSGRAEFGYPDYPVESEDFGKPINITIEGSLSISGTTAAFVDWKGISVSCWKFYEGPAAVNLVRKYDGQGKLISQGQFSVSGNLKLPKADQVMPVDMVERTVFDIRPVDYVDGVRQEDAAFHTGDTIAAFSIKQILDGSGKNLGALNDTNLKDYITCEPIDSEKGSLELDETTLLVSSECVRVSYGEGDSEKTAVYSSLKKAVESLDSLADKAAGAYTFTFLDNSTLTKSLTLPDYVKYALFKPEPGENESKLQLDFRGYTLTAAGDMAVSDSLLLLSSGTAGTIVLTKSNVKSGVADAEDEIPTFTFLTDCEASKTLIRNVDITAKNTAVTFSVGSASPENDAQGMQGFLTLDGAVTADTIYVKSGNWNLREASATTLVMGEKARLVADSVVQGSKGRTQLAPGSVLAVNKKAVLYNPALTAGEEDAHIYIAKDAALEIEGKLTRDTDAAFLSLGMLADGQGDVLQCGDFTKETKLFSTKIKDFPVEALHIEQSAENSNSIYNIAYQVGSNVYAGAQWFTVYARGIDGNEIKLASFTKWTETAAYLNTLSNASMTYIVDILEDVDTKGVLTMPTKAKGLIFRSKLNNITLKATGDIKLSMDTTFENVDLVLTKYNSKTKEDIPAAVALNGKTLAFKGSSADFASISGTNVSALIVDGGTIGVTGAVTGLGSLALNAATFKAGGAIAVTGTLEMQSASLESAGKITIKDLVSKDCGNQITYGGNASGNILTISGTVTASEDWDGDQEVTIEEPLNPDGAASQKGVIRRAAISLNPLAATTAKDGQILLCNAEKAGAGWFVIGENPSISNGWTTIESAAYKSGKGIYKGGALKAVWLLEVSASGYGCSFNGSFATLQEALSEIDRLADIGKSYRIELHTNKPGEVTSQKASLKFPSKVAKVTIAYVGAGDQDSDNPAAGCMYYKGALELKSNLELINIKLSPNGKTAISLGKFSLLMNQCAVDETAGISEITGSGTNGTSELALESMEENLLVVQGNVSKVGKIRLNNTSLAVQGSIETKDVCNMGGRAVLAGASRVTRDKAGNIIKLEPQITIQGTVYHTYGNTDRYLGIRLLEKTAAGYEEVDFTQEAICEQGINIAKAPLANSAIVYAANKGLDEYLSVMKAGGYLAYYGGNDNGVELQYTDIDGTQRKICCRTFGDAVTEINNYKVKREYTIQVTASEEFVTGASPKSLTMPDKRYIASLTISGETDAENGEPVSLPYIGNITFTSDTTLSDIEFTQKIKSGTSYENAPEAANAVTVSTGGYALAIDGNVAFNTPLNLAGGNKGVLTLEDSGRLLTITNDYDGGGSSGSDSVLYGTISKFARVDVKGQVLELHEYRKNATEVNPSKAASLTATDLVVSGGGVILIGDHARGSVTVSNLTLDSGTGLSEAGESTAFMDIGGKLGITNVEFTGRNDISVKADQDFTISGKLKNETGYATVTLLTRLRGAGKAPYLTINGTVETETPIEVGVRAELTSDQPESFVKLTDAPEVTGQLLTAKTALSSAFRPVEGNTVAEGEYSAENKDGYMVMKVGTGVYVYDGSQVQVALCRGNYTDSTSENNLLRAETDGDLLGYYTDLKTASAAVDALKDVSASYTFILTDNIGEGTAPVSVALPSKASVVYVTSLTDSSNMAIIFSGNISLKCATVFDEVVFAPIAQKNKLFYGSASGFAAGGFDLTLKNVGMLRSDSTLLAGVQDADAMALKDISGNGKQAVTLDSPNLELNGGIPNAKTLTVTKDAGIKGNIKASVLELSGDSVTLRTEGAVTLDTLKSSGEGNTLTYTRTAKNATNLTINKKIESEYSNYYPILNMEIADKEASDFLLELDAGNSSKVTLSDGLKLAVMPLAATDGYTLKINGEIVQDRYTGTSDRWTLVKADKGIYLADRELYRYHAIITAGDGETVACLDYQQAINEINNRSDSTEKYTIRLYYDSKNPVSTTDTNLTDKTPYGAFNLPGKNKAASVTVEGDGKIVSFTNDISGTGSVALVDIILNPVTDKGVSKTFNIAVTKDNRTAELYLEMVRLNDFSEARLNQLKGTKNETKVVLKDCDLPLKTGFSNIGDLELERAQVKCGGSSGIRKLSLIGVSSFVAFGKTTLETIDMEQATVEKDCCAFIGTRLEKGNPVLTLNGQAYGTVPCVVYTADSDLENKKEVDRYIGEDSDVPLIAAKKASAASFTIARYVTSDIQYIEWISESDLISYKDGNYVKNGNKKNMAVMITQYSDLEPSKSFYARSFDEAVAAIDNAADTSMYYVLDILWDWSDDSEGNKERRWIKTTKKGTAFGSLTLPSKAAGITIMSDSSSPSILAYTGTLKASCDVTFIDILLTEGTVKGNVFTPAYQITPAPGAKAAIRFEGEAETLKSSPKGDIAGAGKLVMASVSGSKGGMELSGISAEVKGAVSLASLGLWDGARMDAGGKVTVTDLYAGQPLETADGSVHADNYLYSPLAVTITNIYNYDYDGYGEETGNITIDTSFTKIGKEGDHGNTQLAINGMVEDVEVTLQMERHEISGGWEGYVPMTADRFKELWTAGIGKPAAYQKLASMPKAGLENIRMSISEDSVLYKYDGGLYVTDQKPSVRVTGMKDADTIYTADFMEWAQAVKEIDKIADMDNSYTIELLKTEGVRGDELVPVAAVTLPAKAKEVLIKASDDSSEAKGIFFTNTTIALKCPVTMEGIGLICVRKNSKTKDYETMAHTVNTGNFAFTLVDPVSVVGGMYAKAGNITGSAKGSYAFSSGKEGALRTPALKITNVGTVTFYNGNTGDGSVTETELYVDNGVTGVTALNLGAGIKMKSAAAVSVKNLTLDSSALEAKDITVGTLAELSNASELKAGTRTVGDGKLILNNIQVQGGGNTLLAKQDKNGKTLLTINGKITDVSGGGNPVVRVGLYYNNQSGFAQLYDGMDLGNAKNAEVTAEYFVPYYTERYGDISAADGMGVPVSGNSYGIYKNKNIIYYGKRQG